MSGISDSVLLLLASLALFAIAVTFRRSESDDRLPPGPPRTFLIGNVLQVSAIFPQLKFTQWAREYGDILSFKMFNQTFIVISSARAVRLVLDKHGTYTGNRITAYTNAISTGNPHFVNHNINSEYWKNSRKAIQAFFTPDALRNYRDTQMREGVQMLYDLMESPKDIVQHIQRTTASIITSLVYGKSCRKLPNSEAQTFFEMFKLRLLLAEPKAHPPLDFLPFLRWVPERWARWKRLARRCVALRVRLQDGLLKECEERMKEGRGVGCYMESVLENRAVLGMEWKQISGLGGVLLDGGIETTSAFLQSYVVALLNYPEIQERAQKEIDTKIGDRLPTLEDVAGIPYIRALIKEVHRFRPNLPLALPHAAAKDVPLTEYTIPKDSIIFMNIWGIFRDPDLFEKPDVFDPERYMKNKFGTKPGVDTSTLRHNFQFGGGRRLCPGENFAMQSAELLTTYLLWAFTLSKDDSGTGGIDLDSYERPGVELSPLPFTCCVTLRSESRGEVIRAAYVGHMQHS